MPTEELFGNFNFLFDRAEETVRHFRGRKLQALSHPELVKLSGALAILLQAASNNGRKPSPVTISMMPC
jgi:hypothetical protein